MILEAHKDKMAYPLKRPAQNPCISWAEMARNEGHRPGLPRSAPNAAQRTEKHRKAERQSIIEYLTGRKPTGSQRIAGSQGIPENRMHDHLSELMDEGIVFCHEAGHRKTYGLV